MKKKQISFDSKLSLNKETVSKLTDEQSAALEGGAAIFSITCNGKEASDDAQEGSCIACSCNGTQVQSAE